MRLETTTNHNSLDSPRCVRVSKRHDPKIGCNRSLQSIGGCGDRNGCRACRSCGYADRRRRRSGRRGTSSTLLKHSSAPSTAVWGRASHQVGAQRQEPEAHLTGSANSDAYRMGMRFSLSACSRPRISRPSATSRAVISQSQQTRQRFTELPSSELAQPNGLRWIRQQPPPQPLSRTCAPSRERCPTITCPVYLLELT